MPEKHLTSYMNAPLSNVAFELEKSPTLGSIETEAVKRRFSVATHESTNQSSSSYYQVCTVDIFWECLKIWKKST